MYNSEAGVSGKKALRHNHYSLPKKKKRKKEILPNQWCWLAQPQSLRCLAAVNYSLLMQLYQQGSKLQSSLLILLYQLGGKLHFPDHPLSTGR